MHVYDPGTFHYYEEMQTAVREWLLIQDTDSTATNYQTQCQDGANASIYSGLG